MTSHDENQLEQRHKDKMAKRKAVQDAEVASKSIAEKGLLIVNTGPGKGKSTAAFGLILRALGHGWKVGIVQFIEDMFPTRVDVVDRAGLKRYVRPHAERDAVYAF